MRRLLPNFRTSAANFADSEAMAKVFRALPGTLALRPAERLRSALRIAADSQSAADAALVQDQTRR